MGAGAFYKNYGDVKKIWCEIEQGRDFFEFARATATDDDVNTSFCDGSFWLASSPVCRSAHNILVVIGAQQEYIIYSV